MNICHPSCTRVPVQKAEYAIRLWLYSMYIHTLKVIVLLDSSPSVQLSIQLWSRDDRVISMSSYVFILLARFGCDLYQNTIFILFHVVCQLLFAVKYYIMKGPKCSLSLSVHKAHLFRCSLKLSVPFIPSYLTAELIEAVCCHNELA